MPCSELTSTMMVNVYKKVLPATTHDIPWHFYFPCRRGVWWESRCVMLDSASVCVYVYVWYRDMLLMTSFMQCGEREWCSENNIQGGCYGMYCVSSRSWGNCPRSQWLQPYHPLSHPGSSHGCRAQQAHLQKDTNLHYYMKKMQLDVGNEPTLWFAHVTSIILDLKCSGQFKLYGSIIPKHSQEWR